VVEVQIVEKFYLKLRRCSEKPGKAAIMSKKTKYVQEHALEQGAIAEREAKGKSEGVFQRLTASVKRKLRNFRRSRKDRQIYPHF